MLKVSQSVELKLPVLRKEELGIEIVKVPAERVEVKREPVVLVATVIAVCLLLKVDQSVEESWPVREAEAVGKLRTKALVVVVMLKMLPAVPVETLLIMLATVMLVLDWRFLLASVVTREEGVRVAMLMLPPLVICKAKAPVELATLNKSREGKVLVPWTYRVAVLVVVPMPKEPLALSLSKAIPVEELI